MKPIHKRYFETPSQWVMNVEKLYSGPVGNGKEMKNLYEIRSTERIDMLKKRKKILCKLRGDPYMYLTRQQLKDDAIFINTQWSKWEPGTYQMWGYELIGSLSGRTVRFEGNVAYIK